MEQGAVGGRFPAEVLLGERRALVWRMRLLADHDDALVEPLVPKGGHGRARGEVAAHHDERLLRSHLPDDTGGGPNRPEAGRRAQATRPKMARSRVCLSDPFGGNTLGPNIPMTLSSPSLSLNSLYRRLTISGSI